MRRFTAEERVALRTVGPEGEGPVSDATFDELVRLGYGAWVEGFWEVTPAGVRALALDLDGGRVSYYYRGDLRTPLEQSEGYYALARSGFFRETTSKAAVRKTLDSVAGGLPLGTVVVIFRVYRMSRGYEPGKPRGGSEDKHEYLKLASHGAWYDPKTGKAKPPKWVRVTVADRDLRRRRA